MESTLLEPTEWKDNHIEHHKQINDHLKSLLNFSRSYQEQLKMVSDSCEKCAKEIISLKMRIEKVEQYILDLDRNIDEKVATIERKYYDRLKWYIDKEWETFVEHLSDCTSTPSSVTYNILQYEIKKWGRYIVEVIEEYIEKNNDAEYRLVRKNVCNYKPGDIVSIDCSLSSKWWIAFLYFQVWVYIYNI